MTDIVESLRAEADSHPGTVSLDAEAADEIERLRRERDDALRRAKEAEANAAGWQRIAMERIGPIEAAVLREETLLGHQRKF